MFRFSLLKELKKRLRRKRRWLLLGAWFLLFGLFGAAAAVGWQMQPSASPADKPDRLEDHAAFSRNVADEPVDPQEEILARIQNEKGKRPVVMEKNYVCGEESQQLGELDSAAIMRIHEEHPQALIAIADDGTVTFTEMVNDLSPQCKDNAFFGIDADGNLTLFDGLPQEDHVIKTFFQLNIRYLESSLPRETVEQLHKGIRVTDLAEYHSVLSTFSDYAVDETEKVMNPQ